MGVADIGESVAVTSLLQSHPSHFEFFQLVRLLDVCRRMESPGSLRGCDPLIGHDAAPTQEIVRFKTKISASFPASAVEKSMAVADAAPSAVNESGPERPKEVVVNFMGLTGPNGVLPHHFTMQLIRVRRAGNRTLASFQDVFNHRLISLFYRAWEKYRFDVVYERCRHTSSRIDLDPFTRCLLSLTGHGFDSLLDRQAFPDEGLCYFAGHLAHRPRNAWALRTLLGEYLQAPVMVEQFVGRWYEVPESECSRVRPAIGLDARKSQLGLGLAVGDRTFLVDRCLRVVIGPMTFSDYLSLLPPNKGMNRPADRFHAVQDWTRGYCGPEFDIEFQLKLLPAAVPPCRLGEVGCMLGWTSFLRLGSFSQDVVGAQFNCKDRA